MNKDMDLINSLAELASKNSIEYIVETGTHRGLGSTTMLGNAFKNSSSLKSLNTIEIDYTNYSLAKKNLSQFSFVNCCYGCSLDLNDAIAYVKKDEAILHHEKYPSCLFDTSTHNTRINFYELFESNAWRKCSHCGWRSLLVGPCSRRRQRSLLEHARRHSKNGWHLQSG